MAKTKGTRTRSATKQYLRPVDVYSPSQTCSAKESESTKKTEVDITLDKERLSMGGDSLSGNHAGSRPFWGIIADGVHCHPNAISLAYRSHPDGCVLVTDGMQLFPRLTLS